MLHTIVHQIDVIDKNYIKYIVQTIDNLDISNLSPEMELKFLSAEELELVPPSKRGNFTIENGRLQLMNDVPTAVLPEETIMLSKHNTDDLWHFLDTLSKSTAKLLFGKSDYRLEENYSDIDKLYMVNPRSMVYSTTHASCSMHQLVDGLFTDPETQEVSTVSRWTSIKIVENNELRKKTLVFLCDKETVDELQAKSSIKITVLPYPTLCYEQLGVDIGVGNEIIYYCVAYLDSVPIVHLNKNLIVNIPYNVMCVERFNTATQYLKVLRAIKKHIVNCNPDIIDSIYGKKEDIYKPKTIDKDVVARKGIRFNMAGFVSLPSLNKCLKMGGVDSFTDYMLGAVNLDTDVANQVQRDTLEFLVQMKQEYEAIDNPIQNYNSVDALIDLYTQQRELYKKRLNLLRSMFIVNLPEEVFDMGTKFQTPLGDKVFNIQVMEGK